jgi:hydrogenase nickel incorporation protein HypA/HybF
MHEFNVCQKIVDQAAAALETMVPRPRRLVKVTVVVGGFRQLVPAHLQTAFATMIRGTVIDGSTLDITVVPMIGRCRDCGNEYEMNPNHHQCPRCASKVAEIIKGRELYIDSIEVESDSPDPDSIQ